MKYRRFYRTGPYGSGDKQFAGPVKNFFLNLRRWLRGR